MRSEFSMPPETPLRTVVIIGSESNSLTSSGRIAQLRWFVRTQANWNIANESINSFLQLQIIHPSKTLLVTILRTQFATGLFFRVL